MTKSTEQFQPSIPSQRAPSSGRATASLILSVLGFFLLPVVGSVIGLLLGYAARREIDDSRGRLAGRDLAHFGILLGWLGLGFWVLASAAVALLPTLLRDSQSFSLMACPGILILGLCLMVGFAGYNFLRGRKRVEAASS